MEIIGHRGLPLNHIENTLGAFEEAFKNGADAVELDVHLTSDNEIVVFHDFDLSRIANDSSRIYELSLREIKKIRLGRMNDGIPTLDEVIKRFKGKKIYVELKTIDDHGKRYSEALPEIIFRKYGKSYGKMVFISFDPYSISELRSYSQDFPLGLDYEENSEKFLPEKELRKFLIDNQIEYFIPDVKILNKYVKEFSQKFKIAPWVVNDVKSVEGQLDLLSGLITDRCDIISRQLKSLANGINDVENEL